MHVRIRGHRTMLMVIDGPRIQCAADGENHISPFFPLFNRFIFIFTHLLSFINARFVVLTT
jgi:hypothetical protein